jgi:hypothetical protein
MNNNNNNNNIIEYSSLDYNRQIKLFVSVIILGYFGIKIIYGFFFNFYPFKYYYRNVDINTSELCNDKTDMTKSITLNAYIPGMWNNEMADLITLLLLSFIVFTFTYSTSKGIFTMDGNAHPAFIFGYLIGLGYPIIYSNYKDMFSKQYHESCVIRYIYLFSLLALITFIIILNYTSKEMGEKRAKVGFTTYVVALFLILFGLIFSKKNSKNFQYTTYNYSESAKCTRPEKGVIQSSGDAINITAPFAAFIILLLFCYEPATISYKFLYIFMYAILLGIFVSGVSYYGMEYFLVKMPQKECNSLENCDIKQMAQIPDTQKQFKTQNENYYSGNGGKKQTPAEKATQNSNQTKAVIKGALLLFILLIAAYLIYFNLIKKI